MTIHLDILVLSFPYRENDDKWWETLTIHDGDQCIMMVYHGLSSFEIICPINKIDQHGHNSGVDSPMFTPMWSCWINICVRQHGPARPMPCIPWSALGCCKVYQGLIKPDKKRNVRTNLTKNFRFGVMNCAWLGENPTKNANCTPVIRPLLFDDCFSIVSSSMHISCVW